MLYAIQRGATGPIKIGTAGDPSGRLAALQTAHDEQLVLLAAWAGGRDEERALHQRFADARLRGEWFHPTPTVSAYVKERQRAHAAALDAQRRVAQPIAVLHPSWDHHAALGPDERRDAEQWLAVLCDIAPTLGATRLVIYLQLVASASPDGVVDVDLEDLATQGAWIMDIDPLYVAQTIAHLSHVELPDPEGAYYGCTRARLITRITVARPIHVGRPCHRTDSTEGSDDALVDALLQSGSATVALARYGQGFGPHALPPSYPAAGRASDRWRWADVAVAAAVKRRPDGRTPST